MCTESIPKQLSDAIESEDCEKIRRILKENPEQISWHTPFGAHTWLGYAAQTGKVAAARTLRDAGIDVNTGDSREGIRPICCASANGHYEMVCFLLSSGAILDVSSSVCNPLFAAVIGRSSKIAQLLLSAGMDSTVRYTSKTMKDMDAVAFALMRGETDCAKVIAAWNAKGDEDQIRIALEEADRIAEQNAFRRFTT